MDIVERAAAWAREQLGGDSLLWQHVRQVVDLCEQLLPAGAGAPRGAVSSPPPGAVAAPAGAAGAEAQAPDREVLLLAAYLHDVGYATGPPPGHEVRSAEMAGEFLRACGVPPGRVERVQQVILAHVRPVFGEERDRLGPEAKILYDADKLQRASGFAALGVIWEAARQSTGGAPPDFRALLARARREQEDVYGSLYTDRARQLASEGYRAALNYIDALARLA